MTDSASQPPISDDAAMLIERAVRGDLSPKERSRLDDFVAADPSVAEELARAKREEEAMNTAAMLFTERTDLDRMQRAARQKLDFDRTMIRRIALSFLIWVPVYIVLFGFQQRTWPYTFLIFVVPMLPLLVWGVLTARRKAAFRRAVERGDASIADEYTRHLHRSRNENTISRAGLIIAYICFPLVIVEDLVNGNYARAIVLAVFYLVLLACGWKTAFSRKQQGRFDEFFQGRLTLEELFDKRVDPTEPDGE